jgi:hypothetical protein
MTDCMWLALSPSSVSESESPDHNDGCPSQSQLAERHNDGIATKKKAAAEEFLMDQLQSQNSHHHIAVKGKSTLLLVLYYTRFIAYCLMLPKWFIGSSQVKNSLGGASSPG